MQFKTHKLTIDELLERVSLNTSLDSIFLHLVERFRLGEIVAFSPLFVGHEEFNCILITNKGKYVVKFLNKRKTKEICEANVIAMLEFKRAGIPVPKMIRYARSKYLYELPEKFGKGYLFIMNFFEGKTFNEIKPTEIDVKNLSRILAKMHKLSFKTNPEFDEWLLVHFPKEYEKKSKYLCNEDKELIQAIVTNYERINLNRLSKGIVHYDLHRDNIQKSRNGKYAIFDLATVDIGFRIVDLGTFIGLFVMDYEVSWDENLKNIKTSIDSYSEGISLSSYEMSNLKTIILAIQAANILAANFLMKSGEDNTTETYKWYKLGKQLITKFYDRLVELDFEKL